MADVYASAVIAVVAIEMLLVVSVVPWAESWNLSNHFEIVAVAVGGSACVLFVPLFCTFRHRAFKRVQGEAESVMREACSRLNLAAETIHEARANITRAQEILGQAKKEFSSKAYTVFWDLVEQATAALGDAYQGFGRLPSHIQHYRSALDGWQHNFPDQPVLESDMAGFESCLNDLKETVRMGQCDFQFAMIFEQRRTRQVLVAGFSGLLEAISGIEGGLRALQEQVRAPRVFVGASVPVTGSTID